MLRKLNSSAVLAFATFVVFVGLSGVCSAQQIVWEAFYLAGDEAHTSNDRELSLQLYSRSLDEARLEESDHLIAASAARVGEVLFELGKYAAAEESFRISLQAFVSQEDVSPEQDNTTLGDVDFTRVLRGLAASLQKQNKSVEAEEYLRHAIRIVGMRPTPDHALMLELLNSLATCSYAKGDRLAAYALVRRATTYATVNLGADHHATAETSLLYAALVSDAGHHHSAAQIAQEALNKLEQSVGPDHARTARARLLLGKMHHLRGATDDAKHTIKHARESLKAHHPESHPIHGVAEKLHDDAHGVETNPGVDTTPEATQETKDTQDSPQQ